MASPIPHAPGRRNLLILGCSATKVDSDNVLPAITLYDGPMFRTVRSFLRERAWPESLSLAVLSAQHGLIGAMAPISVYDQRMTEARADTLRAPVSASLRRLAEPHDHVELILGQDYIRSLDPRVLEQRRHHFADGPIGLKLQRLAGFLRELKTRPQLPPNVSFEPRTRPLYFLPDWDDFLDVDYDFRTDTFSSKARATRNEKHSIGMMRPHRLCDGVLVSLAQHLGTKGMLRRITLDDQSSLRPASVRDHFSLARDQWAFGDCGAFSYVREPEPTISVKQAVALYQLHSFDFGASVDHIPIPIALGPKGKKTFSLKERKARIDLTRKNAQAFIDEHEAARAAFIPVGVIQGLDAASYARQVPAYLSMGYKYIALGGLVPQSDDAITDIVTSVMKKVPKHGLGVHLLGIYRPRLQSLFRELGISSFDSASYFRKSWLRSDQNYLGPDGRWFAAIRVPPTSDPRTLARLRESGRSERAIKALERSAVTALHDFADDKVGVEDVLEALCEYDKLLPRNDTLNRSMLERYRQTLEDRPWDECGCPMCKDLGIDILVFRGLNRNKRRGAHNTLMLYRGVGTGTDSDN